MLRGKSFLWAVSTQPALVATLREVVVMRELPEHKLYKFNPFVFCLLWESLRI